MRTHIRISILIFATLIGAVFAQNAKTAGVLSNAQAKIIVPSTFFYRGQSASVQIRNSAAVRTKDGKYFLAGLVETAGYPTHVAARYQGFFITEVKLKIGDAELAPGEYGFGFFGNKFVVTDVGANDVFSTSSQRDGKLKRVVPLKITGDGGDYRLYNGKKYVTVQVE